MLSREVQTDFRFHRYVFIRKRAQLLPGDDLNGLIDVRRGHLERAAGKLLAVVEQHLSDGTRQPLEGDQQANEVVAGRVRLVPQRLVSRVDEVGDRLEQVAVNGERGVDVRHVR